jgi:hypothetical protein
MKTLLLKLSCAAALGLALSSCADIDRPYGPRPLYGSGYGYDGGYRVIERDDYRYRTDRAYREHYERERREREERERRERAEHSRSTHHEHCYCSHKSCGCHPGHPKEGCHCDGGAHRH